MTNSLLTMYDMNLLPPNVAVHNMMIMTLVVFLRTGMAEDIKCLTESRMRAMEIIKQKMVEMKNQNEKLSK